LQAARARLRICVLAAPERRAGSELESEEADVLFARVLIRTRTWLRATVRVGGLVVLIAALEAGPLPGIVRRAASIPETAQGLEGFVNAANALITPALVAMAAVAPLGCIVGAGATMFGSRRGMVMIGASLGTLIFLGAVEGIVA
jgi:hypothetical protein